MAEDFLAKLIQAGFDMAYSEDAVLGHTFATPFEYVLGKRNIPVVPFFTNVYLPPLPTMDRCAATWARDGKIIKRPERTCRGDRKRRNVSLSGHGKISDSGISNSITG